MEWIYLDRINDLNTARNKCAGFGLSTAALSCGGEKFGTAK